jgi:hypothetical protein
MRHIGDIAPDFQSSRTATQPRISNPAASATHIHPSRTGLTMSIPQDGAASGTTDTSALLGPAPSAEANLVADNPSFQNQGQIGKGGFSEVYKVPSAPDTHSNTCRFLTARGRWYIGLFLLH